MRRLICLMLFLPSVLFAQTEEQILTVTSSADTVLYVFAHKVVTVDLSAIPVANQVYLNKLFWAADLTNGKMASVKMCSKDSVEHKAILNQLKTFGITSTATVIELTDQQKADVVASRLIDKNKIVRFLKLCATLRTDNPGWSNATVRAIAKGGL